MHRIRWAAATAFILVITACHEDTSAPSEPDASVQPASAVMAALQFQQLSAGFHHTCGVTTAGRAYCWGLGADATETTTPIEIADNLRFRQLSAGLDYTCGTTTEYLAYCWGTNNTSGQLGDGTTAPQSIPVRVAGGQRFRLVDAGANHTCGVSYPSNRVYCWGANFSAQLGDSTRTPRRTPVAVASRIQFRLVSTGWEHTCAVTLDDRAYCWGSNRYGQLGDSTEVRRRYLPVRVSGERRFREVSAGGQHTCALTRAGRAFCWGHGLDGQLGNGKAYLSFWPRAVTGRRDFQQLSAGMWFNCGATTDRQAYCWGLNGTGQLGDGTFTGRLTPVPVIGGLEFQQVTGGDEHTCGVTTAGKAYCWGDNDQGELGNGTTERSQSPVPVAAE
jgi:alpha-tubulin suppressor-like RCC1 family protein